jgi:hypothetical protein
MMRHLGVVLLADGTSMKTCLILTLALKGRSMLCVHSIMHSFFTLVDGVTHSHICVLFLCLCDGSGVF